MIDVSEIIDIITSPSGTLILTIVALFLSLWQLWSARRQTLQLNYISRALTTRYLDTFPYVVQSIVDLIKNAQKEIIIICDYPAYSAYSDNIAWLHYRHEIEIKIRKQKIPVHIVCYDETRRMQLSHIQFKAALDDWEAYKRDNIEKINAFMLSHGRDTKIDELTGHKLLELIEENDQQTILQTFSSAKTMQVNKTIPIYCWIADDDKAIFTFPMSPVVPSKNEYYFFTADQRLISVTKKIITNFQYSDE